MSLFLLFTKKFAPHMVDKDFLAQIVIKPLDSTHGRAAFSCGITRIDNYLKSSASSHAKDDFVKVYVAITDASTDVLGYYGLCPHSLDVSALPPELYKKLPKWPTIPSIYLLMVGVDKSCQKKGLGTFLLADVFKRCIKVADQIGGHFIVLDAHDEETAGFYRKIGFVDLPSQSLRMFINMKTVRAAAAVHANQSCPPSSS